jgi:acetolactate synthase-1/2/3 large subunit/5-guanidino-2-oxopentanoate decarboxylase
MGSGFRHVDRETGTHVRLRALHPRILEAMMRTLGAEISHGLKARGVDVIFGIPGVHNVELYRGIEEAGITHILTRHEQGAGFMADGYARATGKPGVAYVITGPGLCNILTPLGQAYSDSVPVIAISSCLPQDRIAEGRLHEMRDQEGAAATVTGWSRTALDSGAAFQLIDKALAEFASTRNRPVHIQLPIDCLGQPVDFAPPAKASPSRPRASDSEVERVAAKLASAERPILVFGGGVRHGANACRDLMAASGAAAFATYAGKGVVPDDHPLSFGSTLARQESAVEFAKADLVLVLGSELSECDLWRDALGHEAEMVRVDLDPGVLADRHRAEIPVLGDAAQFAEALLGKLSGHTPATLWTREDIANVKQTFRASTEAERPGIARFADAMREVLPEETLIYSDMTQFAYVAKEIYPCRQPGRWHHPNGFGTLGYALPAAIGGKVGAGDAPVVAIAGDYGFHYTMQELGVAVELGLTLPIILWDNGKLKEIEDSMVKSQIPPNAVVARNPDFCALARAFGAHAATPGTMQEFQTSLADALRANGPTLIYLTPEVRDN